MGAIELYFVDETSFTMQPYVPYGWQKKGQLLQIFARNQHKRLNLLGLMSLDTRLIVYPSKQSLTRAFVVEALAGFMAKPHPKPVVIVLDNGSVYRCKTAYGKMAEWEERGLSVFLAHLQPAFKSD